MPILIGFSDHLKELRLSHHRTNRKVSKMNALALQNYETVAELTGYV